VFNFIISKSQRKKYTTIAKVDARKQDYPLELMINPCGDGDYSVCYRDNFFIWGKTSQVQ